MNNEFDVRKSLRKKLNKGKEEREQFSFSLKVKGDQVENKVTRRITIILT